MKNTMGWILTIDESKKHAFTNEAEGGTHHISIIAGVAITEECKNAVIDFLELNHFNGQEFEKGSKIKDDKKIEGFIDLLLHTGAISVFVPSDYKNISLSDAKKNQIKFCDDLESYLIQEHPEYQVLTQSQKEALFKNLSDVLGITKNVSDQEFYNMLMIFEAIENFIRKFFSKLNQSNDKDLINLTIIIDSQTDKVTSLIERGLLDWFLFATSRLTPLNYNGKNFTNSFGGKPYLDTRKFNIKVASDKDEPILLVADYIASFTQKALSGTITEVNVIDKLALLHEQKANVHFFHPTNTHKNVAVPNKCRHAYRQLINDVF